MNGLVKKIPDWAIGVGVVAAIGALAFAGWKGYQYFQSVTDDKKNKAVESDAQRQYKALLKSGNKLSTTEGNYASTANTIQRLLNGCETAPTEIQVIEEIMKVVKKPIDWWYLVSVFGSREIDDCGTLGTSKQAYELVTLLKDQMDTFIPAYVVNGTTYFGKDSLELLSIYLNKIGITI